MAATLTLEAIEGLTEIWEGFSIMDEHSVCKEGCESLDDMKERLRLHYMMSLGQGKTIDAAQEVISTLRQEDEAKRSALRNIFKEAHTSLTDLDDLVKQLLVGEGTMADFDGDLQKHMYCLTTSECPVLVAGETSSGKSSLLNLLLGREILPQSLLSCTSVLCNIRYGPQVKARVYDSRGTIKHIPLGDQRGKAIEQLARYIFKVKDREEAVQNTSVEVFLPIDLLKTGVYIIDSPGFGENPTMDAVLLDYIANNEIFAFIYVIKSDNAGGVQEDRLQRILKFIVDLQRNHHLTNFDPRSAIFVCNRWDLVPEKEREIVKKDTFNKLSRCWPDLQESQLFCLSTIKAWSQKEAGYISEDYSQLLDGIQRLIPVGLQRKVQHSYRWMEHFLGRVLHHVISYLATTRYSSKELEIRHKMTELRLHKVEKESDLIMKRLDKTVDKNIRHIAESLCSYLASEEAKVKMTTWSPDQLPLVQNDDLWMDLESDLDGAIERRLAEVLRDWDDKNKLFQIVQKQLLHAFKEEFLVLESQITSIEQCLQSDDLSLSGMSDEEATRFMGLAHNVDTTEGLFDFNLSTLQKIVLGFAAPVLLPVAVGMLVGAPIFLLWDFKKWRRQSMAQRNMQSYLDDPAEVMAKRSNLILDRVADLDNVSSYVTQQMEPARAYLEAMRSAVPKLVESNRKLMDEIVHDKRTRQEIEERYLRYETIIPRLQEKLAEYGNLYIREYDFEPEQVAILTNEGGVFVRWNKTVGIWTDMRAGRLTHRGKSHVVSVKTYRKKASSVHMLMEEVHLRKCRHPRIAVLLGTYEASRGIPAFVLDGGLVKARQELFGFRALPKTSRGRSALIERSRQILEQVGVGLEFLHYRGLVHMELSLDTVMLLNNKDDVKLTNIGEPRKADLPESLECETGEFCYLPPEVLRGGVYKPRSDMYSFGVMAWELWNQENAFKQQRKTKLSHFLQTARSSMLREDPINPFAALVSRCLHALPEERMCSTTWVNEIRKLTAVCRQGSKDEDDEY